MQIAHVSTVLIWAISLASILCMLLRPRRIAEAYWACGGGILLVLTRLIPLPQAAHAVYEGLDVYLFLTGMMILAELAREEGVFDWVADVAAHHAGNSPGRLFVLIYLVGTLVTALLSNDATAVVLTPAVLAVVRRAKVDPAPYLLACASLRMRRVSFFQSLILPTLSSSTSTCHRLGCGCAFLFFLLRLPFWSRSYVCGGLHARNSVAKYG